MKKLIFLLAMLVGFVALQAQTVTLPPMGNATFQSVTATYNATNTTARVFLFTAPQAYKTTQDYAIRLDSVSGNHTAVAVALFGQKSPLKKDWTAIGSAVTWAGTTKDTIIVISNATAVRYMNYKVTVTGTGAGVTRVTQQDLKLYLE